LLSQRKLTKKTFAVGLHFYFCALLK